jgi:cell division topological specificity factor
MSLFSFGAAPQRKSAAMARERLQILLAHERIGHTGVDFLPQLQRELIDVVRKYVTIEDDQVQVRVEKNDTLSVLEVNIELPAPAEEAKFKR